MEGTVRTFKVTLELYSLGKGNFNPEPPSVEGMCE